MKEDRVSRAIRVSQAMFFIALLCSASFFAMAITVGPFAPWFCASVMAGLLAHSVRVQQFWIGAWMDSARCKVELIAKMQGRGDGVK